MTNSYRIIFKISAIVLCILLVLTMMCSYAHVEYENSHGTQLFAAPFCLSMDCGSSKSEISAPIYRFVSWINPFKAIFEDGIKDICFSFVLTNFVYNSYPYTKYLYRTCCNINKPTVCFLRI